MAVMAQWNSKTWEVSSRRISALKGITASVKLQTENNDDKEGSPATNTKALELQSFSFDFDLAMVTGSDVRAEYEAWTELVGQFAPFWLAGRRFGPPNLQLTEVKLGNTLLDDFGRILKGTIGITLTEYAAEASSQKATAASTGGSIMSAAGIAASVSTSAASIGASTNDKAAKKAANSQLT